MDIQRPERKKQLQRKRNLTILGLIAVVILITVGLNSLEPAARQVARSEVWIESVKRGEMLRAVRGPGSLVPEEIRWISAETAGRVERILIDAGATVTADSVILELSNPSLEQEVQDAKLQFAGAEADYRDLEVRLQSNLLDQEANLASVKSDYASADLEREANVKLNKEGLIPDIRLRQSQLTADQLKLRLGIEEERLTKTSESITAQLAAQRSALEQRRAFYELRASQLDSLRVRAGIDGVLQEVPVETGQRIDPTTTLARVAQPSKLKAELRINETQAKDIQVNQVARIDTRAGVNGIIEGRVSRIDPAVQQGSVTIDVELTGQLPKGARPDLSVDGTVELERLENVLHVQRPVYVQPNSTVTLFKVASDGKTANRVQVQLGRTSVQTIEIVAGLNEGDQVILSDTSAWDDVDRIALN